MKQVLVHLGLPKTGSTAIQQSLRRAAEIQGLDGVTYPNVCGNYNHSYAASAYLDDDNLPRRVQGKFKDRKSAWNRQKKKVRQELEDAYRRNDAVILSSEVFRRCRRKEITRARSDWDYHGFDAVRLLAYVRDPVDMYLSWIQQGLKASSTIVEPHTFHFPYKKILRRWKEFGSSDLQVRSFYHPHLVDGDVVLDFRSTASKFFERPLRQMQSHVDRVNRSLSSEAVIVLQRYRRQFYAEKDEVFMKDSSRLVEWLERSRDWVEQTPLRLRPDIAEIIARNHAEDRRYIRGVHGLDIMSAEYGRNEDKTPSRSQKQSDGRVESLLESYDEEIVENLLLTVLRGALSRDVRS